MITLILDKSGQRESFVFHGAQVAIGRAEDNDLRINSRFVTAHHCRLEQHEVDGWRIVDLDSQNGTLLNDQDVQQGRLRHGDEIAIGPVKLWFQAAPEENTAALADTRERTASDAESVTVSARTHGSGDVRAAEALKAVCMDLRRLHGDERGLAELEHALLEASGRVFPRPAFQQSLDAAKLMALSRSIATSSDFERTLQLIMDAATELTHSERGFLVLRDAQGAWRVRCARNFDHESVKAPENKISRNLAEQVARSGKPVIAVNAQTDERLVGFESISGLKLRSVICLPLLFRDKVIGTLYLDNRFKEGNYGERELRLLETFADQAAVALENARLLEENIQKQACLEQRQRDLDELADVVNARAQAASGIANPRAAPTSRGELTHDYTALIGESPALLAMLRVLDRVVGTDLPVLITGESGTGKELVAAAVHRNSSRKDKPFLRENCAAIPESLLESELFGHKRGSFTGAVADRRGLFEEAHGGTIMLDEIGEMSLEMQAKLLRVLENGEIRPVGSTEVRRVDVRIVTASNRDLQQMVREGSFREDLYFRLNVVNITPPPLRDRMEDLPLLVQHFLKLTAARMNAEIKRLDPLAMRHLRAWHWPGNVRELQNEIQRAVALSGAVIGADDLSQHVRECKPVGGTHNTPGPMKDAVRVATNHMERDIIQRALEEAAFLKSEAARRLGISRPTLDQKIRLFGLGLFVDQGRKRHGRP
ncbi:MAG: GAF domain-containing protein [Planctomycetes bacterium]|nr:GAF domain-containing protein [Planctomycetota bacterium]